MAVFPNTQSAKKPSSDSPAADSAISYTSYSSTLRRDEWDLTHLADLQQSLLDEFARWEHYLDGRDWIGGEVRPGQADGPVVN